MRKLSLALTGAVALVALMGLSATSAVAVVATKCQPLGNPTQIIGFKIDTRNSKLQYASSGIGGEALACGSDLISLNPTSNGTLYVRADIQIPKGVKVANTTGGSLNGRYVGSGRIDALAKAFGIVTPPVLTENQSVNVTVDAPDAGGTTSCNSLVPGGSTLIACYLATGLLGSNHNAIHENNATKRLTLTIGRIVPNPAIPGADLNGTGLTALRLNLCEKFGNIPGPFNPGTCGSGNDPVVQFNGTAPSPDCATQPKELGTYKVTATMANGTVTPQVQACVDWKAYKSVL